MSHYLQLYSGDLNQSGRGLSDISVYRGPVHRQRGRGIGNFLLSAFHYLKPLLSSGVNVLADEGIKSTRSVLSQLGKKDLPTILREERSNVINNFKNKTINQLDRMSGILKKKQAGSGINIGRKCKVGKQSGKGKSKSQKGKGKSKSQKGKGKQCGKGKSKSQKGKGRKAKSKRKSKSKRTLDIFDIRSGRVTKKK